MSDADKSATREPAVIEHEIEATRERLAGTIDQLVFRTNPKNIARREIAKVKAYFVDPHGSPRAANIAKVVGGTAGFVAVLVVIRKVSK